LSMTRLRLNARIEQFDSGRRASEKENEVLRNKIKGHKKEVKSLHAKIIPPEKMGKHKENLVKLMVAKKVLTEKIERLTHEYSEQSEQSLERKSDIDDLGREKQPLISKIDDLFAGLGGGQAESGEVTDAEPSAETKLDTMH